MTVPLDRLPGAVVACPVRAAAAVVRWVAGRSGFVPELSADEIVAEELAAWAWDEPDEERRVEVLERLVRRSLRADGPRDD